MITSKPLLQVSGGSKRYGGAYALDDVDFDLCAGEIHALLGENGAGKSTLAKVMAGAVQLTSGVLMIDGVSRRFHSPFDSISAGIAMVYQETSLISAMTVGQNVVLGREPWFTRFCDTSTATRRALNVLNFFVDPLARVESLGPGQRQMVEIGRAVHLNARVLIFDEPTASLSPAERETFFNLLQVLRQRGKAIVFITHALEEALAMSDRITVLRDGKRVACAPAQEFDRSAVVRLMVGRDVRAANPKASAASGGGETVLLVDRVTAGNAVRGMSFSLKRGEVVGLAGLVGSGRSEIAKVIAGVLKRDRVDGGTIYFRGAPISYRTPGEAIADGIAYVTEDRKVDGLFDTMTADDNIYLSALARSRHWRMLYSQTARTRLASFWIEKLAIKALDRDAPMSAYSGGNQQKVVIAKSLVQNPDVIFFDEPTRGVDVGAIPEIHQIIRGLAESGIAVMVISSYLPEIMSVADRILVARRGRIVCEFDRAKATENEIMQAAAH